MADPAKITRQEAQANAAAIQQFWQAGHDSLARLDKLRQRRPAAVRYGHKLETFGNEAKRLQTNVDTAGKMRRIAEEYAFEQMQSICALVEKHRSRFGPTNWVILLRIEDRKRRDALMRRAIRKGWTSSELERVVQARRGSRRPYVGRKPNVPADPVELLLALDSLSEKWLRWCAAAQVNLPDEVQTLVSKATKAVRQTQQAVAAALDDERD